MKKQTRPLQFFQRVAEAFVPELTKATFGRGVHARKTEYTGFFSEVLCACMKDIKQKRSFAEVSQENIASRNLQAE